MPSRKDLRALRDKYDRMLALREAHARARSDECFVEPDPRPQMAKLAEEFPGALREIDRLPLEVIVARIEALVIAERDASRTERWMHAQVSFHQLARGALVAKRWLAGRKHVTAATRDAFLEVLPTLPRSSDAQLFLEDLARVANPPRGRLMDLVHAKLAASLNVTEREARALVFGPPAIASRKA
jgi:hypothetical protein